MQIAIQLHILDFEMTLKHPVICVCDCVELYKGLYWKNKLITYIHYKLWNKR